MKASQIRGLPTAVAVTLLTCGLLTAAASRAQSNSVPLKMSHELGVTATHYKYTEPGVMSIKANKIGFDYSGTYTFDSQWPNRGGWFLRADLRYANGKADYSSNLSGSINDVRDWYYEARGLIGKEFDYGGFRLAPYAGLGFRHLYNDLRGVSTTGARGYRRESNYTTLPIGLIHKMPLSGQSQLHTTLEYSQLLQGRQEARLTDANPATPDVSLRQKNGYGLRLGTMVRFDSWSIGPTLIFWRIKQSETGGLPPVLEPKNNTYEVGLKASYHF
jgi:hypothetical protein